MKISKRDWTQLSAYLDGELSQRDLTKLENRIKKDPDFQAALEGLRDVKAVLSHTPRLSVPRNFTLKPALVQSPQRRAPVRGYRLAAAALSFLFIGVVVLDLGSVALKGGLSAAQAPMAEEVMLEAAADAMEEPEMMAVEEALEESAPAAEMEEAPQTTDYYGEGESVGMEGAELKAVEEEAERATGDEQDAELDESQNALTEESDFGPEETQIPPEPELIRSEEPFRIPWMTTLEIVFGLGAVGFGIAAWRKRQ